MSKYKQGYSDRKNESYSMGGMGVMGHEKNPSKCDVFSPQKSDLSRLRIDPMNNRGYPSKAMDYKY